MDICEDFYDLHFDDEDIIWRNYSTVKQVSTKTSHLKDYDWCESVLSKAEGFFLNTA